MCKGPEAGRLGLLEEGQCDWNGGSEGTVVGDDLGKAAVIVPSLLGHDEGGSTVSQVLWEAAEASTRGMTGSH